jgi:hypothetical protein
MVHPRCPVGRLQATASQPQRPRYGSFTWTVWLDEELCCRVPAPCRVGRDVRSADPAIDAKQPDAVRLLLKHTLPVAGEPEP